MNKNLTSGPLTWLSTPTPPPHTHLQLSIDTCFRPVASTTALGEHIRVGSLASDSRHGSSRTYEIIQLWLSPYTSIPVCNYLLIDVELLFCVWSARCSMFPVGGRGRATLQLHCLLSVSCTVHTSYQCF